MELLGWLVSWVNYLFPVLFLIFFVYYFSVANKKQKNRYQENIERSLSYEKEAVDLLKEIRDLLKK